MLGLLIFNAIYLFAVFKLCSNWLFAVFWLVMLFVTDIVIYSSIYTGREKAKEEAQKAEEEAERKRRFERGHLEDGLNPEQREVWDCLHHIYRTDEFGAQDFIRRTKNKHEERMATMKFWDGLCKFHIEQYWKSQEKCSACLTSFRRDADRRDAERRKLQKEGLVDEKGNYIFWDNFPDNWKWSDEELAALDKDDNRDSADNDDWYDDYIRENPDILNAANGNETV